MRILCFGDSNTYGYDPRGFLGDRYEAGDRWVDLLAEKTGHECIGAGVNGRVIPRGDRAVRVMDDEKDADLLLVMLGTNDLLQGASAEEAAARMEAFLSRLSRKCLLVCPPPMQRGAWVPSDELVRESIRLGEKYLALDQKRNIPVIDTRSWNIPLAFDGVHFTEEGHRIFAKNLQTELERVNL